MPIVGIPIFGDQPDNAARLKERGLGQTFFNCLTLFNTPVVGPQIGLKLSVSIAIVLKVSLRLLDKSLLLQIEMDVLWRIVYF